MGFMILVGVFFFLLIVTVAVNISANRMWKRVIKNLEREDH